jgi:rubrerythrin
MSSLVSPIRDERRHDDPRVALACSVCGYGIALASPPDRCPMCQQEDTWIHRPGIAEQEAHPR